MLTETKQTYAQEVILEAMSAKNNSITFLCDSCEVHQDSYADCTVW